MHSSIRLVLLLTTCLAAGVPSASSASAAETTDGPQFGYRSELEGVRKIRFRGTGSRTLRKRVEFVQYFGGWGVGDDVRGELERASDERARLGAFDVGEDLWRAANALLEGRPARRGLVRRIAEAQSAIAAAAERERVLNRALAVSAPRLVELVAKRDFSEVIALQTVMASWRDEIEALGKERQNLAAEVRALTDEAYPWDVVLRDDQALFTKPSAKGVKIRGKLRLEATHRTTGERVRGTYRIRAKGAVDPI